MNKSAILTMFPDRVS